MTMAVEIAGLDCGDARPFHSNIFSPLDSQMWLPRVDAASSVVRPTARRFAKNLTLKQREDLSSAFADDIMTSMGRAAINLLSSLAGEPSQACFHADLRNVISSLAEVALTSMPVSADLKTLERAVLKLCTAMKTSRQESWES